MARTKPKPIVVADLKGAEATLQEIAALDRNIAAVELHMRDELDRIKAEAKAKAAPLQAERKQLAEALATYATLNKAELFDKRKSLALNFGIIGFRLVTKLAPMPRVKMEQVLEKLSEHGFHEAIRTASSVNKEAMRDWPDSRLETVGMQRKTEDTFFIEIPEEQLKEDAA